MMLSFRRPYAAVIIEDSAVRGLKKHLGDGVGKHWEKEKMWYN